jgi:hypothetical protein
MAVDGRSDFIVGVSMPAMFDVLIAMDEITLIDLTWCMVLNLST